VLYLAVIVSGFVTGGVGFAYASHMTPYRIGEPIVISICCAFIGIASMLIVSELIHAGIITTFVCYSEDPYSLQRTKPKLYKKITEANAKSSRA
jgi:hypothetical protein